MPKPRQAKDRVLAYLDLRDEEWQPLFSLKAQVYPGHTLTSVVKEVLRVGLSHDLLTPALRSARAQAYLHASMLARSHLAKALTETVRVLEADVRDAQAALAALEAGGPIPDARPETGEYFGP